MASNITGSDLSIDSLVEMITKSGKEMFALCYRKADRKTKVRAIPLLEKIRELEVCAFLLDMFLVGNDEVFKPLSLKLIMCIDKSEEELTNLKSKLACNRTGFNDTQLENENEIFSKSIEEVKELILSIDKRVGIGKSHFTW